MQAHYFLTEMKINDPLIKDYSEIEKDLVSLLNQYGITPYSIKLQILLNYPYERSFFLTKNQYSFKLYWFTIKL